MESLGARSMVSRVRTLKQRHGTETRRFELVRSGVLLRVKTILSTWETTVGYDVFYGDKVVMMESSKLAFVAALVLLPITILTAVYTEASAEAPWFWGALTLVAVCAFLNSRRHLVGYLDGDNELMFYTARPSEAKVNAFIEEARTEARAWARSRFLPFNPSGNEQDDRNHLQWLLDKEIISASEFGVLVRGSGDQGSSSDIAPN